VLERPFAFFGYWRSVFSPGFDTVVVINVARRKLQFANFFCRVGLIAELSFCLACRQTTSVLLAERAREHRLAILNSAGYTSMIQPVANRRFEDYSLIVALATAFRFYAVGAVWTPIITLDTAFPTGHATSFASLAHLNSCCRA
jgi:ABC-type polysaccharide/polyol phosphate export permease